MIINERKTNFNMSYAKLSILSYQSCDTIMRDIAEFERFGISSSKVTAFQSQVEALDNTPQDEELQGIVTDITLAKNKLVEQAKTLIREATLFIKLVYPKNTGVYNSLKLTNFSQKSNYELYRMSFGIVRIARLKADSLSPELQTVADELESVSNQLRDKLKEQYFAMQNRDLATQERVELANSIYKQLSMFYTIGQGVWLERNEAKYNDYIIYGSSSAPPQNSNTSEEQGDEGGEELPNV